MILARALAIVAVGALAWAGFATWQAMSLRAEVAELRQVIQAHEAAGRAWEAVYKQQKKESQDAINDAKQWAQSERDRAERLARERSVRLRNAPSGAPANGGVPEGGDFREALETCHERLRDAGDETRGAIGAFESLASAVRSAAVNDEERRRVLASTPCVQPKP